jgi:iron complex outermembrane receptor protein
VEGGLRWHNEFVSLSTSLYQATRKNVFTTLTVPNPSGPGNLSEPTVFSYRSKGWETDLNLRPLEGWNIIANYTVGNAAITSLPTAPANIGKAAPGTPATLANLWTSYQLPLGAGMPALQLSAGLRYRSHMYADMGQTRFIPGEPLFDAAIAVPLAAWRLRVGVENLADRRNWTYGAGTGSGVMPGQGRTFFFKADANL